MADQDWNGLPYGHFGNAIYHSEEQSWQFEKVPDHPRALDPIGHAELIFPPSLLSSGSTENTSRNSEIPSVRHGKGITGLVRSFPAFQPATSLLRPLLHASEAVQEATHRHDPAKGSLLSFGRVFDESTRRSTQIVAFAAGPTGSYVRLVQVQLQKQGWDDSRDVWLEMPVISGEEALWKGEGSPVQQVTFAQPLERGESLLAVRTHERVLIFKPVLGRTGPKRLRLKLLFETTTTQNDGVPYEDVVFNPWFPRQFAVIDRYARWRVYEFRSRESSDATCVCSAASEEHTTPRTGLDDGWARLLWIGNPSTVLIASRRAVTLYDIAAGCSKVQSIEANVSDVSRWVLDIAEVPSDPTRIMVLTTTHLHLVSVIEINGEMRGQSAMRIRHFRSPEDITLCLALFREEEALTVIIRSAFSTTMVAYSLDLGDDLSVTLHDPTPFEINPDDFTGADSRNILELHLQSVTTAQKGSANVTFQSTNVNNTLLGRLREDGCRIISLAALKKDLSIERLLYLERPIQRHLEMITPPTWRGKLMGTSAKIKDSFVVDDDFVDLEKASPKREPAASYVRQRRHRANRLFGTEWTLPYERTAGRIQQRGAQAESVDDVLMQVRTLLEKPLESDFAPMRTVLELAVGELTMSDTAFVVEQMQELTTLDSLQPSQLPVHADEVDRSSKLAMRPLDGVSLPGLSSLHRPTGDATYMYNSIVSHWISSLPNRVPGRIRLAKEQLARRLAAELTLASHVIQIEDIEEPVETQQDAKPNSQHQTWDLPMHLASSQPFSSQLQSQSQSQSVLPTPSPTGTPSVTTASSRASTFASAEISHLKKYTTFTKHTPSTLPRSLTKILNHWTLGSDPASYDWIATSRSITQQTREEEADSQLTEKQRARAHRKAERHMRRQRKEAQASQVQMLASSQMPELVVSASQPQHSHSQAHDRGKEFKVPSANATVTGRGRQGLPGSSQSFAAPVVAASQGVAGRFGGGRPPAKKKRKQGF